VGTTWIGVTISLGLIAFITVAPTRVAYAQSADSAWPMFHHDAAHTGLSTVDTSANVGTLAWSVNVHTAQDTTSPVIGADGTIYVGSEESPSGCGKSRQ
jgi:PKD repeat protein